MRHGVAGAAGARGGFASPSARRRINRRNKLGSNAAHSVELFWPLLSRPRGVGACFANFPIGLTVTPPPETRLSETDWTYGACPLDISANRFGPFESLVEVWQRRRGTDRPLPARGDFPVEDFAPWMGRIFIAKIEHQPFNLRFTLWGTILAEWWGVDYTNKTLGSESLAPETWREERAYFQEMVRAPFIGVASGYLSHHNRRYIKVISVDLPLADDDEVTHILSAHIKIDTNVTRESVLQDCPIVPVAPAVADAL